jgi:hypothetical protein
MASARRLTALGNRPLNKGWMAVAIAAAIAFSLSACGGDMRPEELARSVDTLTSSAAEGALVADGVARDRTKTTFVRARARELGETVDHEAEKLSDATPQDRITGKQAEAVNLAKEISEQLGDIQISPADQTVAREARQKLDDLSKRADELSKSL